MFQFENQYKLYNLYESLSLDNLKDDELMTDTTKRKEKDLEINPVKDFLLNRIVNYTDEKDKFPLTTYEKMLIDDINTNTNHRYVGIIPVQDLEELKSVLEIATKEKYLGLNGNFNWIDTSRVESFLQLFKSALDKNCEQFNGDISLWDTSKVRNMMQTFYNCKSLKCDISNWDTSKVKLWDNQSYYGTPAEFQKYCKKLKFPSHILRNIALKK